ncbi:MAG: hypothetical protein JWO90_2880 [Solirubrobacterales bacterium]|jgi:virulence factor Mce-like protein|nr:hypothetical protein [Solirubrobacterales bacterium]
MGLTRGVRRIGHGIVDHPFAIVCVLLIGGICFYLAGTRSQPHHVRATFASGQALVPGLDVQIDGVDVGKISSIKYDDGRAIVGLGINDDAWPLPQGTTAVIRYGTTLGNGTRRIDLDPGPKSAPAMPEDGVIRIEDTQAPVEFDQIFNTFPPATRKDMEQLFEGGARTFSGRAAELNEGLRKSAPALEATADLMSDLSRDEVALRGLVVNGDRATRVLAGRGAEIRDLMTVMAGTMDVFARKSRQMQASLEEFAPTLKSARTTLTRLNPTVDGLDRLATDLKPAAVALRPFAADARPAIGQLARTAPLAVSAVRATRSAAPSLRAFFRQGQTFSKQLDPVMARLAPQVSCIRPYAPELGGFLSNWSSFTKNQDADSHYARIKINEGATSSTSTPPVNTDSFLGGPGVGLSYAMPRPPGLNQGTPWLLPECGAGAAALDASKDPEDGR